MEYIILNNQIEMPILGLGVFQVPDKKECQESVFQAIKAGICTKKSCLLRQNYGYKICEHMKQQNRELKIH